MSKVNGKRYKLLWNVLMTRAHRAHWTHPYLTRVSHGSSRCTPNSYPSQQAVVSTVWPNFPCTFRVSRESYMCTAGVRYGQRDLGMTSLLFPCYYRVSQVGATREEFPECMEIFHTLGELWPRGHVCCGVSPCGQELVRGDIRIFKYEVGGTCVFTVLLPCGGQFLHFPHARHS